MPLKCLDIYAGDELIKTFQYSNPDIGNHILTEKNYLIGELISALNTTKDEESKYFLSEGADLSAGAVNIGLDTMIIKLESKLKKSDPQTLYQIVISDCPQEEIL